ncbi:MAG: stage II sporulation protein R [Bacilli bacterium]|nr:stage II sporulation protein R [Bacilli bacterium]
MKKIIVLLCSILIFSYMIKSNDSKEVVIPDEAIRFRVVAASNTIYDQNVKIQVRNEVQNRILELLKNVESINDIRRIINEHKEELSKVVNNKLKNIGYDKKYTVNYGYNYFPKKKYKGITYKEGNYESLVITLGEGKGENFWCVLFPPLCLIEANDNNKEDVEYKFFVKEIIDKYLKK